MATATGRSSPNARGRVTSALAADALGEIVKRRG
jgi:hypothetical protein